MLETEPVLPRWLLVVIRIPRTIIQSIFKGPLRPVLQFFNLYFYRTVFHFSAHKTFDGINLYCFDGVEKEIFFEIAVQALDILERHEPRRYKRVKTYLENIVLMPSGNGYFEGLTTSFIVDSIDPARPAEFAAEIVHEATHGLLHAKGLT